MGVNKLTKYAKACQLYKKVDLKEIADDFRRNFGDPVIAVDGSECAHYLYQNGDSLHGGQYKEFRESCKCFVERFRDAGFRLYFFFYGLPVEEKASSWLKDRGLKTKKIWKFFQKLRAAPSEGDSQIGNPSRLLPSAMVPCATVTFRQLGCKVRVSITDRDTEMAQFAASDRFCVGVLSNNSDFMIYGGVPCLFTLSDLKIGKKLTTLRFCSADLASHLGIEVDDLPVFASFVGNLIVRKETLLAAHKNLKRIYGHKEVPDLVAELLKRSPRGDLRRMCELAFGNKWREHLELVQKSVCCYKCDVGLPVPAHNISRWDTVLRHVEDEHVSGKIPGYVFTVMKCRITRCGVALEDLSSHGPDCLPTNLAVRRMLARMYVVLLWDSGPGPFRVTEDIQTGLEEVLRETVEVQKLLPEGIDHPGLLELWSGAEDDRWRIFTWVVSPAEDLPALRALSPQHLVVPTTALFYLYREAKILTQKDVRIFVIVAVSVKNFSGSQLSSLHVEIPAERAIYLATLFVNTALCVLDAAGACGLSFPQPADCHLDAYFDGKLFHHIYSKLQHTSDLRALTEWDADLRALTEWDELCEETFSHIMNIIGMQNGTTS